jgi:hypothetical protein
MTLGMYFLAGLDCEPNDSDTVRPALPNEGIRRSLLNARLGALAGALCGTLLGGLASGLSGALIIGSLFAIIGAQVIGAYPCLQHLLLRLCLWHSGLAPFHYIPFLDYAVGRIFLNRAGGGYMFIHRSLLEYFAALHCEYGQTRSARMSSSLPACFERHNQRR